MTLPFVSSSIVPVTSQTGFLLGLVIAHELGHILLPARAHSRNGIMQENYNVLRSCRLKFTAEESAAMRAFIDAAQGHVQINR